MRKRNIFDKKGQNTVEYAILIALVIAAAVAMQTYVKRGVQGRVHDASDKYYSDFTSNTNWATISNTTANVTFKQYEPKNLTSQSTQQTLQDTENTTMTKGGTVTRESIQKTKQATGDYQKYDY